MRRTAGRLASVTTAAPKYAMGYDNGCCAPRVHFHYTPSHEDSLILLALVTGARCGKLLALQWPDLVLAGALAALGDYRAEHDQDKTALVHSLIGTPG